MSEQLISVLRQPQGLLAIISSRQESFTRPGATDSDELDLDPYREEIRPLADARLGKSGPLATVPESWDSLAAVSRFDSQALYHMLNVLIHTLPGASTAAEAPPLKIEAPATPAKPTAAHPRAFRGTKAQPPKPRHSSPIDLRPHLCVPGDTNRLVVQLAPYLDAARQLLQAAGLLLPGHLPCLVDKQGRAVDVYLSYCHQAGHHSLYTLPGMFRRNLLFWLRGGPGMPWDVCWPSTGPLNWSPVPRFCAR